MVACHSGESGWEELRGSNGAAEEDESSSLLWSTLKTVPFAGVPSPGVRVEVVSGLTCFAGWSMTGTGLNFRFAPVSPFNSMVAAVEESGSCRRYMEQQPWISGCSREESVSGVGCLVVIRSGWRVSEGRGLELFIAGRCESKYSMKEML